MKIQGGGCYRRPAPFSLLSGRVYPSGKTVDEKRRTHCHYENNDNTDDEVLYHIAGIDFLFIAVCNGDFNADICTPYNDDRRECDYYIDSRAVHFAVLRYEVTSINTSSIE